MKTLQVLRMKIYTVLGSGNVLHHIPTQDNHLGQSGVHTFASDMIDIVLNAQNEAEAYKNIITYLNPDLLKEQQ